MLYVLLTALKKKKKKKITKKQRKIIRKKKKKKRMQKKKEMCHNVSQYNCNIASYNYNAITIATIIRDDTVERNKCN